MISLIPYKRLVFHTSLTVDEAYHLMANNVLSPQWGFWLSWRQRGGFEGPVTPEGFKIWKRIKYQNSFLPVAVGSFQPSTEGTDIEVTIRVPYFAMIFIILWFSPCAVSYLTVGALSTCVGAIFLLYLFVLICFNPEFGNTVRFVQAQYGPYEISPTK